MNHLLPLVPIALCLLVLGCTSNPPAAPPDASRPLVGVSYFAGWWPHSPNKWEAGNPRVDWRPRYPGRVPLLGEFNTQETMDKEIDAAADHGIDFWAILWYPHADAGHDAPALLNRGLDYFLASRRASRMSFVVEICNHAPFLTQTDAQWDRCIASLLPAFKHPSCLKVDGRIVVKIHSAWQFWRDGKENAAVCEARISRLRTAIREAGLGEAVIAGGGNLASMSAKDYPAKLFDFTGDYMMVPELPATPELYPYEALAGFLRGIRKQPQPDSRPYMPVVGAGWDPRPWGDKRPSFTMPTRAEWTAELRQVDADLRASPSLGIPRRDGTIVKAFTIYAWNEFGEGGIIAPNRAENAMKIEAIRDVFGPSHLSRAPR